ncbi:MAG: PQQ-dependent sugar dehydrogenase [Gemmatimonadaceae bacterium]
MLRQSLRRVAAFVLPVALLADGAAAQGPVYRSSVHDYRVVKVVDGFVNPWAIAFLPGGDMLVTERPGRLRLVRKGQLLPTPMAGAPTVVAAGPGGLLDVALPPDFAQNRFVYLTYSKQVPGGSTTALYRAKFENDALVQGQDLFIAETRGRPGHFGSRIAFDRNGHVFLSVGERQAPPEGDLSKHPAQDLGNHHGKIIRLMDDGRVPSDNPFVGKAGAKPEIWSYGHRNPQGLIVHPVTGQLWETEHGPQGGDELNLIEPGKNYGWPVVGFGVNYGPGKAIHASTMQQGMENAKNVWVPSIATSGLLLYTGDKFTEWKGSLFVGGLAGQRLARVTLDGDKAEVAELLVRNQGRIRDVRQGPDGFIYLAIDDQQGKPTPIVRLEPVARR